MLVLSDQNVRSQIANGNQPIISDRAGTPQGFANMTLDGLKNMLDEAFDISIRPDGGTSGIGHGENTTNLATERLYHFCL